MAHGLDWTIFTQVNEPNRQNWVILINIFLPIMYFECLVNQLFVKVLVVLITLTSALTFDWWFHTNDNKTSLVKFRSHKWTVWHSSTFVSVKTCKDPFTSCMCQMGPYFCSCICYGNSFKPLYVFCLELFWSILPVILSSTTHISIGLRYEWVFKPNTCRGIHHMHWHTGVANDYPSSSPSSFVSVRIGSTFPLS